jgi:hypothetical protein
VLTVEDTGVSGSVASLVGSRTAVPDVAVEVDADCSAPADKWFSCPVFLVCSEILMDMRRPNRNWLNLISF